MRTPVARRLVSTTALLLAGVSLADATAAEPPKVSTAGLHLGGPIAGPEVTEQMLTGRVVILELWGMACEPCATTMPILEQWHRTLGPQGLVVVGSHIQEGTPDAVRQAAARLGTTFAIVGNSGIEGLGQITQMPCTLLFDHTGKCVFMGSALEAGPALSAAMNAAPPLVLNGRALGKLAALYPLLRAEASFGTALKKARGLVSSRDEDVADEARFVVEKLEAWGRDAIDSVPATRGTDPGAAFDRLQRCGIAFKGDPLGAEATRLAAELRKDRDFQAALRCGQQLAKLEALRGSATGGAKVVTPDVAAAVPPAVKRQMRDLVDGVNKAAPGTKMAERAAEIAGEFGLGAGGG